MNKQETVEALREVSRFITQNGFSANSLTDTIRADRILVPFGNGDFAVYQMAKNGTAKLKTVLIAHAGHIMANGKIELTLSKRDKSVGYLSLPGHPGLGSPGVVVKQIRLADIYSHYKGVDLYLDFDKEHCLIGVEFLNDV